MDQNRMVLKVFSLPQIIFLGSTDTDGSTTTAWLVGFIQSCSEQLTRTAKCSRFQRLPSIDAGIIRKKPLPSSLCELTQDESATLPLRERDVAVRVLNCSWTAPASRHLCFFFKLHPQLRWKSAALVDCRLPSTWACSQLQLAVDFGVTKHQCERRKNCKINAQMPSVWIGPYAKSEERVEFPFRSSFLPAHFL